ncbi:uncharacterized protein SPSK_06406 [Sporothrix schenckii 1099-18]|uniref:Mid2 domain-containing protein n=2 Tax=Sporothrix schenckii TaxID=29908 RepID=U7PUB4_SPOS1|nr:uncharacterized protein SPSK_06406 [Sporothrix schenckii 1099-18]ERS98344.1 hypothetical protein HMPREF1624_05128 [Sporothrix schenckii ATCC 58251]KJR89534.1 hypothetical protein SPSK_06406 [Sporothrix schenckii 1099-18]
MKSISRSLATYRLLSLLVLSGLVPGITAQCFNLDGSPVTDPGVVPCLQSGANSNSASMCCNLGRQPSRVKERQATNGDDSALTENASGQQQLEFTGPDICLANGLCQLQLADAQTGRAATPALFSRDSCTQPDWSGGCLRNVCSSVTGDNAALTPCGGSNQTTQWCCGSAGSSTTANCCANWPNHPNAVQVPALFGASSSSSPSSGGSAELPRVGQSGPFTSVSVSVGFGGVVTLVTVTVNGASQVPTGSTFAPSATNVGSVSSRPATNTPASTQATVSSNPSLIGTALGAEASRTGSSDTSDNGEAALVTDASGLSTQEVAGIVAGLVVLVVILVSIGCFMAENMYKKRQQRYRARQLDAAMKQSAFPLAKSRPLM